MINFTPLYNTLNSLGQDSWAAQLQRDIPKILNPTQHGDLSGWFDVLKKLPQPKAEILNFTANAVSIFRQEPVAENTRAEIKALLQQLHPWRKGPFNIHGVEIDAEWRSDIKWKRLENKIRPLKDRLVLDVGCGNGYYGWRMLGAGAQMVVGIEPFLKNIIQFLAVQHFAGALPFYVLPIGIQDMPENLQLFDTVFSMGVLYHRRSPFDHLFQLKSFLKPGGELVLETLIIDGTDKEALVPNDRYAKMRNVWFLPSTATLQSWLERAGFKEIQLLDISKTTIEEQRRTEWMTYESLSDFLKPGNPNLTIEGYPAPLRAMFSAVKP